MKRLVVLLNFSLVDQNFIVLSFYLEFADIRGQQQIYRDVIDSEEYPVWNLQWSLSLPFYRHLDVTFERFFGKRILHHNLAPVNFFNINCYAEHRPTPISSQIVKSTTSQGFWIPTFNLERKFSNLLALRRPLSQLSLSSLDVICEEFTWRTCNVISCHLVQQKGDESSSNDFEIRIGFHKTGEGTGTKPYPV